MYQIIVILELAPISAFALCSCRLSGWCVTLLATMESGERLGDINRLGWLRSILARIFPGNQVLKLSAPISLLQNRQYMQLRPLRHQSYCRCRLRKRPRHESSSLSSSSSRFSRAREPRAKGESSYANVQCALRLATSVHEESTYGNPQSALRLAKRYFTKI